MENNFTFCGYTAEELCASNGVRAFFKLKDMSSPVEGEIYVEHGCVYLLSDVHALKGMNLCLSIREVTSKWKYDWVVYIPEHAGEHLYNAEDTFEYLYIVVPKQKEEPREWRFEIGNNNDTIFRVRAVDAKTGAHLRYLFTFDKRYGINLYDCADFSEMNGGYKTGDLFDEDGTIKTTY